LSSGKYTGWKNRNSLILRLFYFAVKLSRLFGGSDELLFRFLAGAEAAGAEGQFLFFAVDIERNRMNIRHPLPVGPAF